MKIKGISDINFTDYKLPSLYIATAFCSFKCDKECGRAVCQNGALAQSPVIDIDINTIVRLYNENPITQAIVFGGLEPLDDDNFYQDIQILAQKCGWPRLVIYTGYTEKEVKLLFPEILTLKNLIIKYGRFIPDQPSHFDDILGVNLASPNQYAKEYNITDE